MINFDDIIKAEIKEHNPNWPQITDHLHKILISGDSGSGKANSKIKMYLYAERSIQSKISIFNYS